MWRRFWLLALLETVCVVVKSQLLTAVSAQSGCRSKESAAVTFCAACLCDVWPTDKSFVCVCVCGCCSVL